MDSDFLVLEVSFRLKPGPRIVGVRQVAPKSIEPSSTTIAKEPAATPAAPNELSAAARVGDPNDDRYQHTWRPPSERKWVGVWRDRLEQAERGIVPELPDYSAPTHAGYRKQIAALKRLVDEKDIEGLKATTIAERSSTPMSLAKYRDLAIHALAVRNE